MDPPGLGGGGPPPRMGTQEWLAGVCHFCAQGPPEVHQRRSAATPGGPLWVEDGGASAVPKDPRGSWERVCHHAWGPSGARMVGWGIYHHPRGPMGVHCCAWGPTMGCRWWSASMLGATPGVTGWSPPRCLGSLRGLLAGIHCSAMGAHDGWRVGVCCGEQGPARGHQQGYTAVSCVSLGLAAGGPLPCPWAHWRSLPGVCRHAREPCGSHWQGSIGEAGGLPGLAGGSTAMPGGPP